MPPNPPNEPENTPIELVIAARMNQLSDRIADARAKNQPLDFDTIADSFDLLSFAVRVGILSPDRIPKPQRPVSRRDLLDELSPFDESAMLTALKTRDFTRPIRPGAIPRSATIPHPVEVNDLPVPFEDGPNNPNHPGVTITDPQPQPQPKSRRKTRPRSANPNPPNPPGPPQPISLNAVPWHDLAIFAARVLIEAIATDRLNQTGDTAPPSA